MRKSKPLTVETAPKSRVLARVLAEELEGVSAALVTEGLTTQATFPDGGRKDITNWTYDNDGPADY